VWAFGVGGGGVFALFFPSFFFFFFFFERLPALYPCFCKAENLAT